jgi:hypothetical protein
VSPRGPFAPFAGLANEHDKHVEIMPRAIGEHVSLASNDVPKPNEELNE